MFMIDDYGQETYNILSKLIKIKFAKYLKNSGIELEDIYQMKNLKNDVEFYLLEVNKTQIRFNTPKDFLFHFIQFLKKNIEYNDKRYRELTTRQIEEFTDEIALEMKYKQVDCYKIQQIELLKIMQEHYDKLKNGLK